MSFPKTIKLFQDKEKIATIDYTIENLLMLHTIYRLETINPKQEIYEIKEVRK